jgi:hypothetical protein
MFDRDETSALERRNESAAKALKCAWLLGLVNPEKTPIARNERTRFRCRRDRRQGGGSLTSCAHSGAGRPCL